jgi:hypothetical protein
MMNNSARQDNTKKKPGMGSGKTRPNMQSNQGPGTSQSTGKFAFGNSLQDVSKKPRKRGQPMTNGLPFTFGGKQ